MPCFIISGELVTTWGGIVLMIHPLYTAGPTVVFKKKKKLRSNKAHSVRGKPHVHGVQGIG